MKLYISVWEQIEYLFFLYTGARLQLFGSSKNGFGFRQSDLDICMVLEGQESIDVSCLFYFSVYHLVHVCVCFWCTSIRFLCMLKLG